MFEHMRMRAEASLDRRQHQPHRFSHSFYFYYSGKLRQNML